MQVCTLLQTDNHASTPPLSFYRPDALPATQPTASKQWRHDHFREKCLCIGLVSICFLFVLYFFLKVNAVACIICHILKVSRQWEAAASVIHCGLRNEARYITGLFICKMKVWYYDHTTLSCSQKLLELLTVFSVFTVVRVRRYRNDVGNTRGELVSFPESVCTNCCQLGHVCSKTLLQQNPPVLN